MSTYEYLGVMSYSRNKLRLSDFARKSISVICGQQNCVFASLREKQSVSSAGNKIKAFSFLEIMVAIVISGVVMSTAYSVYIFVNQQYIKLNTIKADVRDYFEFSSTISRDFELAKKVVKTNDYTISMEQTDKTINYQFEGEYVLRVINFHTDTFFFAATNLLINTVAEFQEEQAVDFVKMKVKDNEFSFYKNYGAIAKIEE